jgi:hypothetical protein
MSIKNKSHLLKKITRLAYFSGIIFIISGMLLSLVSKPVFAKGNQSGASLAFTSGCDGDCEHITATVCNTGTEDMEEAVQWELYMSTSGANQRTGVDGFGGSIQLDGLACTTLSVTPPAVSGQYWFKAYQPEGHPGKGELFSGGCSIEACSVQNEDPIVPTHQPTIQPTGEATVEPTIQPTSEPTSEPTLDPTSKPPDPNNIAPSVKFTAADTGICQYEPGEISATIVVTLPEGMTARLQAEYHIVHPDKTDHHYIDAGIVSNGDTFTYQGYWPGINPEDVIVEIHFGAALLDAVTGNPLEATGSLDYFWYPYICPAPTATPTPTPAIMQPLEISNQCTNTGVEWTLVNSNPYPVSLDWSMNNGILSGSTIVPASSSIQVNTSASDPQVVYFYWLGPEDMYGYSTEIYSGDSCIIDPAVTPTPTDEPGDPSPTPNPTDDPGDPTTTPAPTDDPGDPSPTSTPTDDAGDPAPTSTPADPADTTDPSASPTPTPEPGGNVSLPVTYIKMSSQVQVDLAPLNPPMAVASAENARVLIPVTGADVKSPLAGGINNLLIHLGLVFIGVALMTQAITKKFVGL